MKHLFGREFARQTTADKTFDIVNYTGLLLLLGIVLYPLYFVVIASFSDPNEVAAGNVSFYIKGFKNLAATIPAAFAFSRKELVGSKFLMLLFTFTMFFGGGLIPSFLLIKSLGMYNTVWALVLPGAVSVYNLIVARTFFQVSIPNELYEAAIVEGSDYFTYFFKIVLPISKPIIAVMLLIHAVGHWNAYFSALVYISDNSKMPLQVVLREVLIQSRNVSTISSMTMARAEEQRQLAEMIKYGVIIVSSLPVLIMYPFVQKHFIKGMLIGAVKG